MREDRIIHESGDFWVADTKRAFTVFKAGITHSVSIQDFAHDEDGKSLAVAYCQYLGNKR